MEQNEQIQETPGTTENTGTATAEVTVDTSDDMKGQVTEQMATVKIEGQEFELEASLAQDDNTLKVIFQPHFASVENANITRDIKDGKLPSPSSKKCSTRDSGPTPFEILRDEAEQTNPAILLTDELMRRDAAELLSPEDIEIVESVLHYSRREIENVQRQLAALVNTPASPSGYVPVGF